MISEIVDDRLSWNAALADIGQFDFAHTFSFHESSSANGEGSPILFVLRDQNFLAIAAWPLLKRPIEGGPYWDFTSVYGHVGPIFRADCDVETAMTALIVSIKNSGAVSLFSRMHPLWIERVPSDLRGERLGDVVVVQTSPTDNVLMGYRPSHRREILNSRAKGLRVEVDLEASSLSDFTRIYRETMRGLNASNYYFFDDNYFIGLLARTDQSRSFLINAKMGDQIVASAIFVICGKVLQYYLSGTDSGFRKFAPTKAILARAHEFAIEYGLEYLVLGGGVGSQRDALFAFKAGFSSLTRPFYIFKRVLKEDVYVKLCANTDLRRPGFFPRYRA